MNDMNNYTHRFPEDQAQQLLNNQSFFFFLSIPFDYFFDLQVNLT